MKRKLLILGMVMAFCAGISCVVCAEETSEKIEVTGQQILLHEMVTVTEQGKIEVRETKFTDLVQAEEAADDSVKITPSDGNICLDIKLIYSPLDTNQTVGDAFSCSLVMNGNSDFESRLMLEAGHSDGTVSNGFYSDLRDSHKNYLVNVAGMDNSMMTNYYYLYDYIVEVPEEVAGSEVPIYLQLEVGDSEFYYEVQ